MADIEISYDALTNKFQRKMQALQRDLKKTDDVAMRSAIAVGVIGTASIAATSSLFGLTAQVTETRREVLRLSEESGLAASTVDALRKNAEAMGREASMLDGAMEDLGERIRAAATGVGDAAEGFAALGVSATDANGNLRRSDEVLRDLLGALEGVENQEQRAALATIALGDAGRALGTSVDLESLDRWTQLVKLIGVDYGPEAVEQTRRFEANMVMLKTAAVGAGGALSDALDITGAVEKATLGIVFTRFLLEELSEDASESAAELGEAYDEANRLGGMLDEGIAAKIPARMILLRGLVATVESAFSDSSDAAEENIESLDDLDSAFERAMFRAREFHTLQQGILADLSAPDTAEDEVSPLTAGEDDDPDALKRTIQQRIELIEAEAEAVKALGKERAAADRAALEGLLELNEQQQEEGLATLIAQERAQEIYYDSVRSLSADLTSALQSDRMRDKKGAQAAVMGLSILQRAAALFQIAVSAQAAIGRQFADLPYPAALGTSVAIGLQAGAQAATVLSAPLPVNHTGTVDKSQSLAPDERIVRKNEATAVFTAQALEQLGGALGVGAMNAGRSMGGQRGSGAAEVFLSVRGATLRLESDDDPVPWRQ